MSGGGGAWPRLRDLPAPARLGVACLVLVIMGGMAVSAVYLRTHYEKRDERAGLTLTDIEGAYHGVRVPSPMLAALRAGHPEGLEQGERDALVRWLEGEKLRENYDNLDLGDNAPSEILARSCASCHGRASSDEQARRVRLEDWSGVQAVAFGADIRPSDRKVMLASAHAHTLSLATLCVVVSMLLLMTRVWRGLSAVLIMLMGVGLLVDMGAWWVARAVAGMAWLIVAGGVTFSAGVVLSCAVVLIDLVTPRRGVR